MIFETFKKGGIKYLSFFQFGQWVLISENGDNFGAFSSTKDAKKWIEKNPKDSLGKAELRIKPINEDH